MKEKIKKYIEDMTVEDYVNVLNVSECGLERAVQ